MTSILLFALSFCPTDGPVVPDDTLQMVVGLAPSWDARTATLYRFTRKPDGPWKAVGGPWQANLGKNGLGAGRGLLDWCGDPWDRKVEGDKKAPAGIFRIGKMYGFGEGLKRAPRGKLIPLTPGMECISDPSSPHYNRIVDLRRISRDWDWARPLRKPDKIMSRAVVIGLNGGDDPEHHPPIPDEGSCILFHVARDHKPTVGCTSLSEAAMDALVAWLRPASKPVYVLMTAEQYRELSARPGSGLPPIR